MFNLFKRKPKEAPMSAQTIAVRPSGSKYANYDKVALAERRFRPGMWVTKKQDQDTPGRAGILVALNSEGIARVMLVQEDGTNLIQIETLASGLRQARLGEIPRARIHTPDEVLIASGYARS